MHHMGINPNGKAEMRTEKLEMRSRANATELSELMGPHDSSSNNNNNRSSSSSAASSSSSPLDNINNPRHRSKLVINSSSSNSNSKEVEKHGSRSMPGAHLPRRMVTVFRAILDHFPLPPMMCAPWLALPMTRSDKPSLGNRVTGTLFGLRKGHVFFSVQEDPRSEPVLLLELATPTNSLVKEMASGLVRIALECERAQTRGKLFSEPVWTMYCNGRRTGYAIKRVCSESDLQVLSLVRAISMGAGVLPKGGVSGGGGDDEDENGGSGGGSDGELMYMRARFERVVGSKDSEAFYMMNPDGTGGPELSIFLLRI